MVAIRSRFTCRVAMLVAASWMLLMPGIGHAREAHADDPDSVFSQAAQDIGFRYETQFSGVDDKTLRTLLRSEGYYAARVAYPMESDRKPVWVTLEVAGATGVETDSIYRTSASSSNRLAYSAGTPRLEPLYSGMMAALTAMTSPLMSRTGPPLPPCVVSAS
jgi:hypothetical protein